MKALLYAASYFFCISISISTFAQEPLPCELEYLGVKATSSKPLLSWQDATNASIGSIIKTSVAPNSYIAASFAVRAVNNSECSNISVYATDFTNSKKPDQLLSSKNIRINYVKKWFQAGSAWTGISPEGQRKLVPELLLNDPNLVKVDLPNQRNFLKITQSGKEVYVDVSAENIHVTGGSLTPATPNLNVRDSDNLLPIALDSSPQQIWLSIAADVNTPSGLYAGNIVLKKDSRIILKVPVEITVFPFSLPTPKLEYSIFYRGQLLDSIGTISSEYKNEEQYVAEMNDMKRHGISNPTIFQDIANTTLFKRALTLRHGAGFIDKKLYYLGLSAASATNAQSTTMLTKQINQFKTAASPLNYSDLYICGIDEAKGADQIKQLSSWTIVKQAGVNVFTTGQVGTYDNVGSSLDMLVLAYKPDPLEVQKFHNAQKRVLTYAFPQTGPENPDLFRRNYGVILWATKVDGAMPYAYMHSFGSSWNDFDAEYRDHHFVYPTANGVIDTIAWEGFHEGIEDVRYLTALENSIAQLESTQCRSNSNCQTLLASAKAFLTDCQAGRNIDDLDALRAAAASLISGLQSFTQSPPSAPTPAAVQSQ